MRAELRIIVVGNAGRASRELRLSAGTLLAALLAVLLLPASAGALLGAQQGSAWMASRLMPREVGTTAESSAARRVAFLVLPRSASVAPQASSLPRVIAATSPERRGHLRIRSLHHGEAIDVVPFSEDGVRDERAFAAVSRLFRCRVTGHEVPIDEELVRVLVTLNELYDQPLELISGHRVPGTIETSPTSQHTLGTAADVRVPGVAIDELQAVARELGARGVGLYTQKRFVHIDVRSKAKFFWSDVHDAAEGEDASLAYGPRSGEPIAAVDPHAHRHHAL